MMQMVSGHQEHGLVRACLQTALISESSIPGILANPVSAAHSGVTASGAALWNPLASRGTLTFGPENYSFAKKRIILYIILYNNNTRMTDIWA